MASNVLSLRPAVDTETRLVHTHITDIQADAFQVAHPDCNSARRALSCLIEPLVGDQVLLALDPAGMTGHVLAVLERPGAQDATLALPGGARLRTQDGALQLCARSVQLEGEQDIALNTGMLKVTALSAATTVKHWQGWFDTIEAQAISIGYTAKALSSRVGRIFSRALESVRSVEGLDETRAGRSRTVVQQQHELRAGHINARAEGFVKIDGQKIDLG
ncbi:MAG TPA: DUF3540 domain-containing protein [Castellaniella sp.]|nr:DUF3540 domain-containing protein [Castellaniella sp.]